SRTSSVPLGQASEGESVRVDPVPALTRPRRSNRILPVEPESAKLRFARPRTKRTTRSGVAPTLRWPSPLVSTQTIHPAFQSVPQAEPSALAHRPAPPGLRSASTRASDSDAVSSLLEEPTRLERRTLWKLGKAMAATIATTATVTASSTMLNPEFLDRRMSLSVPHGQRTPSYGARQPGQAALG